MKKHISFKITLSASILIASILFTGCTKDPDGAGPVPKISFDVSNAEALAGIADTQNRSARAADPNALLQKIFDDGTVDSAMDIEGNSFGNNLSHIDYVILPPENTNSKEIYLLLKKYSQARVKVDEDVKDWYLSPLLCIHEDNSYDDVLLNSPYDVQTFNIIDSKNNIQFLKDGSLVYLIRGEGYDHFLNKWDPVTKQTTQLCKVTLSVEDGSLFVRSFSINKDEDYIYMYLDRVDANSYGYQYLKIIKISDSSFDKEIGNGFPGVTGWCYNPYDDSLYYSKYSDETEPEQGLFKTDKTGSTSEHLASEMFSRLIPESAQKVWGVNSYDGGKFTIQNILSEKSETGFVEKFSYTAPEHYLFIIECDYIFANDNLYLNHRFYCDGTGGHKDAIIVIPLSGSDSDIKNLLAFNENIMLHSWTVNEDSLFISGSDYETKETVNCKIDLKTGAQVTIQSDSTFSSIAAF